MKVRKDMLEKELEMKQSGTKNNVFVHINSANGITLMALVITVIVLLILAGVSITIAVGENGILTRTKEAVKRHSRAEVEEAIQIAYSSGLLGKYDAKNTKTIPETTIDELKAKGYNVKIKTGAASEVETITLNPTTMTLVKEGKPGTINVKYQDGYSVGGR